jgi:hypothetical protein
MHDPGAAGKGCPSDSAHDRRVTISRDEKNELESV